MPGEEYRIHCRARADGVEEVYLDENEMSNSKMFEDATFFKVGIISSMIIGGGAVRRSA